MRNFYFHSKVNKYAKSYILFLDLTADISQRKKTYCNSWNKHLLRINASLVDLNFKQASSRIRAPFFRR